jgi:hypothetical protein
VFDLEYYYKRELERKQDYNSRARERNRKKIKKILDEKSESRDLQSDRQSRGSCGKLGLLSPCC